MISNIYFDNNEYTTLKTSPSAKEVKIYLPKNWSIELNGYGGRELLDSSGNSRQLLTQFEWGYPVPYTVDNYGKVQSFRLAA